MVFSRRIAQLPLSFLRYRTSSHLPRLNHVRTYSQTTLEPITKIEKILLDNIKTTGPISFASYMQLCLSHPTEGYYQKPTNPVFGSHGDFITSPEISQVFGELVGIWLISQWMKGGQSRKIRIVELGPGRGTLMDDVLRVINQFPASRSALTSVHLIDNSLTMQAIQKHKLTPTIEKTGGNCTLAWHDIIDDIPSEPEVYTMLIAHEFFDALPVNVILKDKEGWHEVLIDDASKPVKVENLNSETTLPEPPSQGSESTTSPPSLTIPSDTNPSPTPPTSRSRSRFRLVLSPPNPPTATILALSSPRYQTLPIDSPIEVSHASFKVARKIGEVLGGKGCALIVDYGGEKAYGDSFRAFKEHKNVDVFHRPGECDLTANVDFAYLKEAFAGLVTTHGPLPQSDFLTRMGIHMRVEMLKQKAGSEERKEDIDKAAKRLVDKEGMGSEYMVLGVTSHGTTEKEEDVWPFVAEVEG